VPQRKKTGYSSFTDDGNLKIWLLPKPQNLTPQKRLFNRETGVNVLLCMSPISQNHYTHGYSSFALVIKNVIGLLSPSTH